jgi:alkylation response protein AidB-like acyl-CoA dehydrogenase
MIGFTLTQAQQEILRGTRLFAQGHLVNARNQYTLLPSDGITRFQATQSTLATATALGLVKSLVPPPLGGTGGTLVDSILITEELFTVEPSVSLTLLGIGLGLSPIFLALFSGREELRAQILAPFLEPGDGKQAPLASFCFSEPSGSANYFTPNGKGIQTTATYDTGADTWVVNGEKIWGTSCCGWDTRGADLQVVVVRNSAIGSSKIASTMLIMLTRAVIDENRGNGNSDCYSIVRHVSTPGHTACAGPHIRFSNMRIPARFVLATGAEAVRIVTGTFTASAAIVGAMSVGIMRAAFDSALDFARTSTTGGNVNVLEHQSPADLLIDIKCCIEACRALTWRAAASLDNGVVGADELAYEAKIYASEAAVKTVAEAMRVVGVRAYDAEKWPFARLMADAMVLPVFDGGNQGIRRRQIQNIFQAKGYEPWAATFGAMDEQVQNGNSQSTKSEVREEGDMNGH